MTPETFNRLQQLRMETVAAGFYMDELRPRFARLADRHENGAAPRAVSAFQLFQTPAEIAGRLADLLRLEPGAVVLEPSAGLGRLLDALQPFRPAKVVAVELAPQCAGELFRQDRTGVQILQRDFLEVTPEQTGLFDAVIMNPPFHMRSDIKHIEHALSFLRPGGRLAGVCMDTPHREKALRGLASQWIKLPSGAFRESATGIATCILVIDKS